MRKMKTSEIEEGSNVFADLARGTLDRLELAVGGVFVRVWSG
jgi:hypothetical protein